MKPFYIFSVLIAGFLAACKKDQQLGYVISGTLLESSSHPIPVRNYTLNLYQKADIGYFGGVLGVNEDYQSDNNGHFRMRYARGEYSGMVNSGTNTYSMRITSRDQVQYKGLYAEWYPLPPNKDTTLNTIYLYKKIEKFVLKVQFATALASTDSLSVTVSTAEKSVYNWIRGPVAAGTVIGIDTIRAYKTGQFYLPEKVYHSSATLSCPGYHEICYMQFLPGDEAFFEQLVVYKR